MARGAFTRPNVEQRAVLYRYCLLGHDIAKDGIAIFEGGKVVGNILFDGGEDFSLGSLPDIDGDGLSELVLGDGSVHQGYAASVAIVIEVASAQVKRFGVAEVFSDNCGAMVDGCRSIAYRISAKPGRSPVFYRETFTNRRKHWIRTGSAARYLLQKDEANYSFVK